MDFSITEEQSLIIDSFKKFLGSEIHPIVEKYKEDYFPKEKAKEIQKSMIDFGIVNGFMPEKLGGFNLETLTFGMMMFELAKVSPDIAITTLIHFASGKLMMITPKHLQDKYLSDFMSCDKIASVAMSEPGTGSDVSSASCQAVKDGDDYLISGEKMWISSGDYSDFLYCLVSVKEDGEDKGLGVILIDREHGYETTNIEKTALNSQSTAQAFMDNIKVPAENMVVEPGKALPVLFKLLSGSRPVVGLMALGCAQAAFEAALQYSLDRTQFGKPIAAKQLVQEKLATMTTKIEAAKLLCFKALNAIDNGARTDIDAAMAKWYATDIAIEVTNLASQLHGGNGITKEFPVEYFTRAARVFLVTEGTNDMQKLMIGRSLTGISAF